MGKVNFNWNNYTGEHMGEPLRVKPNGCTKTYELDYIDGKSRHHLKDLSGSFHSRGIKPLIKSISDLTDEELLFVFGFNKSSYEINKTQDEIYVNAIGDYNKIENHFNTCNFEFETGGQQILNRLYSLHVSLDYEELTKNNKAVRKI